MGAFQPDADGRISVGGKIFTKDEILGMPGFIKLASGKTVTKQGYAGGWKYGDEIRYTHPDTGAIIQTDDMGTTTTYNAGRGGYSYKIFGDAASNGVFIAFADGNELLKVVPYATGSTYQIASDLSISVSNYESWRNLLSPHDMAAAQAFINGDIGTGAKEFSYGVATDLALGKALGVTAKVAGIGFNAIAGLGSRATIAAKTIPLLRQQYIDAVKALAGKADDMRLAGHSVENIARTLHADRRALGVQFKDLTPPAKLAEIYARNERIYGDKLGPSIAWLRNQGKSWEQIIESASRPGGKDLIF